MGGGSSKPRLKYTPPPPPPPKFPRPPLGGYDTSIIRNNKKHEIITTLRARRNEYVRAMVDSLRGKRLVGNFHPFVSFDGKDYWLYLSIGDVSASYALEDPPSARVTPLPPKPPVFQPPPVIPQYITAYEHVDYRGKSRAFHVGRYGSMPSGFNRSISSIRVPRGRRVTVYNQTNFRGSQLTLSSDANNLTRLRAGWLTWNDQIQSMIVS